MKCYKILFTKDGILFNIGSYMVIFLIIFYFISILFFKKDMKIIEMTIKQIVYTKNVMNKKNQKKNKYKKK